MGMFQDNLLLFSARNLHSILPELFSFEEINQRWPQFQLFPLLSANYLSWCTFIVISYKEVSEFCYCFLFQYFFSS